ncbi:PAS domain S-box-containing protein [Devosia sp. UYZn731]|uniref:hybrid sensor histidine kinase/response regulator n=1 Tax=Devosia sp. UYZn731 TaxID=3156345 RepID=UPI0033913294
MTTATLSTPPDPYRLLLESITDYGIYMLSPDGRVSSWNAGAKRFKGYSEQEILGQNYAVFFTPEDLASGLPARALAEAADKGRYETQGWRIRKDGTRFWVHAVIDPIRDAGGNLMGFAKITRDLTERREAELELYHSQEMFKRLVLGVTDYALYMLSPEGIVTNWNLGAERIKGYRPEEIVGHHFSQFYTPDDRAKGRPAQALEVARTVGRFEKEGWRVRKDGTQFFAHVIIDAIRDPDGTLIGYAKITRDITERMEAQRQLEVAREQLLQSQKMEAIGQLTGGVAHDFNNLLMVIMSSLELMQKRMPQDTQLRKLLANAQLGAERGAALTRSMLAFARRQQMKIVPVDVSTLVRSMRDMLAGSLGASIEIEIDIPPGLPLALSDPNQLAIAVLNLAVNARDAMPGGGIIRIEADAKPGLVDDKSDASNKFVRLRVIDSGEGMDGETLAKAAEPFFTTKGVGKGTGLGLSMVHGIAEQSGGRLLLRSVQGSGTTAEIWLPVAAPTGENEQPNIIPAAVEPINARRRLKVLAVDDDFLVLLNTSSMLEDLGHSVVEATSAEEAVKALGREQFDLIITDHSMPRTTGSQLASMVHESRPEQPIIIATGYAELPEGGADHLPRLSKPFSQAELDRAIWGVIS